MTNHFKSIDKSRFRKESEMPVKILGEQTDTEVKHVQTYCQKDGTYLSTYQMPKDDKLLVARVPGFQDHFGVFNANKKPIPKDTVLGTYMGAIHPTDQERCSDYCILIDFNLNGKPVSMELDAQKYRGWAAYINSFKTPEKANVTFGVSTNNFTELDEMCYHVWVKTTREIAPGEQLGVYYGPEFVDSLPNDDMAEARFDKADKMFIELAVDY